MLQRVLMVLTVVIGSAALANQPPTRDFDFDAFWSVLTESFVDPDFNGVDMAQAKVDLQDRLRDVEDAEDRANAINALLRRLGMSHTQYYTPDHVAYYDLLDIYYHDALPPAASHLFPDGSITYTGIGVITKWFGDTWHVIDILEGSPAADADILVGDAILKADDDAFHPIHSFRDRSGDPVTLILQRDWKSAPHRVEITPIAIQPRAAYTDALRRSARIVEDHGLRIGIVRIRSYASETYHDALKDLLRPGGTLADADGLVVDIRGGWGGANPDYLSVFNPDLPELTFIGRDGSRGNFNVVWRKPVVLLVDRGTRSGKEVLAYGMKKANRGSVVGERTAGAVCAGRAFVLRDGSILMLAVARVEVDGVDLEGVGVEPDMPSPVDLPTIQYAAGADPHGRWAIEVAAGLCRARAITDRLIEEGKLPRP